MKTIKEFAYACRGLDNDGIYDLFEDGISQELRDRIYNLSAHLDTPEPCRAALIIIGETFEVQELIDY